MATLSAGCRSNTGGQQFQAKAPLQTTKFTQELPGARPRPRADRRTWSMRPTRTSDPRGNPPQLVALLVPFNALALAGAEVTHSLLLRKHSLRQSGLPASTTTQTHNTLASATCCGSFHRVRGGKPAKAFQAAEPSPESQLILMAHAALATRFGATRLPGMQELSTQVRDMNAVCAAAFIAQHAAAALTGQAVVSLKEASHGRPLLDAGVKMYRSLLRVHPG